MRESAAIKARRYLAEGRVTVVEVGPELVSAIVRGDGTHYHAGYRHGEWSCDCPAVSKSCSHLLALRLVTCPDVAGADARLPRP